MENKEDKNNEEEKDFWRMESERYRQDKLRNLGKIPTTVWDQKNQK